MGKSTYSGTLHGRIHGEVFDQHGKLIGRETYDRNLGSIPVMVRVRICLASIVRLRSLLPMTI